MLAPFYGLSLIRNISKIYLEWGLRLKDKYTFDEHIHRIVGGSSVPFGLSRSSYVNSYSLRFVDEEQEKKFCPLIRADPRGESFGPVRGYKMDDEIHDVCCSSKPPLAVH